MPTSPSCPQLTLDDQIKLEDQVANSLDVSTLVVPIGGVGVYPTMVMETTDLGWLLNTIAHEWTHNYLTLRPLGLNYSNSKTPETAYDERDHCLHRGE